MSQASAEFIPTRIAILTVSSRRGEEDDTSGHLAARGGAGGGAPSRREGDRQRESLRHPRSGIGVDSQR